MTGWHGGSRRKTAHNGRGGVAGEAVAGGLLRHGARVAVLSRSGPRLAAIRTALDSPRLYTYQGATDQLAGIESIRDQIVTEHGPVDAVVAALGGWWEGPPLSQLDPARWDRIIADNLTSHFLTARALLPMLIGRPGSVYAMLGGVGATLPLPGSGPVSVAGAGQTRLLETLAAEQTGVRLHEVRIMTPMVTRHWDRTDRESHWLTGEQVGDYLAAVVSADFPHPEQLVLHIPEP